MDLTGKAPAAMIMVDEKTPGVNLFPERMAIDPVKKEVYTLLLGSPCHKLHVASYRDGGWKEVRTLVLTGEPNHIHYDEKTGTVAVFFAGSDDDGLVAYDANTWEVVRRIDSSKIVGSSQFSATDRPHGKLFFTNIGFSPLYETDERLDRIVQRKGTNVPLVGIAVRQNPYTLYVSSPMTRDLKLVDPETLDFIGEVNTRGGLAEIDIDEPRARLYVGDYNGNFSIYSLRDHQLEKQFFLGRMLRSIHRDEKTGRVFACSGCGAFEIVPEATRKSGVESSEP